MPTVGAPRIELGIEIPEAGFQNLEGVGLATGLIQGLGPLDLDLGRPVEEALLLEERSRLGEQLSGFFEPALVNAKGGLE